MNGTSPSRIPSVAAAVVTYNPDLGLLERALRSIRPQVSAVYVFDNGSSDAEDVAQLCSKVDCELFALGENLGIAAAYNRAFQLAKQRGIAWVITCDQDSVMPAGMVDEFQQAMQQRVNSSPLGIVCPNFVNRTTARKEYPYESPAEIDECISSGSMTSVDAWTRIGGFDEAMFIDGVDFDFCKRLRDADNAILLVPSVCIEHEIGDAKVHRFLGHEFLVLNHSAFRKFCIAQNIIYTSGKYNGGHVQFVAHLKVLKQLLLVLFYEADKKDKLRSIIRGARHGKELLADASEAKVESVQRREAVQQEGR